MRRPSTSIWSANPFAACGVVRFAPLTHRLDGRQAVLDDSVADTLLANDLELPLDTRGGIEHVFRNLFENALDAPRTTCTSTSAVRWTDEALRIKVQDNGPGVPASRARSNGI